ncbi:MAG: guanitoxin biosynthesis MATE family efflux transporter GntT [Cyanobacteria bacterium P01_H01_bin.35]
MTSSNNLLPRFLRLAVANSFSNLMVPLASLVDAAFLGHLADIDYLAGVALSSVLFSLVYGTVKFLRLGTTGLTAQAQGRSDQDEVLLTLLRNGLIGLVIGLIILLLQQPLREIGFTLLSATPSVLESGIDYYNARIWGVPAVLINFVLIGWFMGREQGTKVLVLSAVANGGNVILDYLFIVIWKYESAGAGLATAASQYLMLLVGLIFIIFEGWLLQIPGVVGRIFDTNALKVIFKLNADLFLARLTFILTCSLFTAISASLGTLVLAANTLLLQVLYLAADFVDGLSFATESLAGSFRGAAANEELAPLLKMTVGINLGLWLIAALMFILFPDPVFGVLTNHGEVIQEIHRYFLWLLPVLGCWCLTISLNGYFLGLTEGTLVRNSIVSGTLIGFLPAALVAWQFDNAQILWLALLLFLVVRTIILGIRVPSSFEEKEVEFIGANY